LSAFSAMRIPFLTYSAGLLLVALTGLSARDPVPSAVRGVIDLRDYNFKAEGPLELKGEFEFYWNQMLNPAIEGDTGEVSYIRVPGSWNHLRKQLPEVTRYGFATYRLVMLLPEGVDELSFRVKDVYSASGYLLNGKVIDYLGFPGVNKYQTLIKYSRPVISGSVSSREAELLVKVSNFDHRLSGIVGGIRVGLPGQMRQQREKELFHGHFLIGAFMIIGIYFLGLYLIRSDQYRLFFSVICLLMALRVTLALELPVIDSLNLNGLTLTRLNYLCIYFFAPFFTLMIRSIFPIEFPRWAFRVIMWLSAVFIVTVVVSPISLFSYSMPGFFGFFLLFSLMYLYVVSLAWHRGRSHAPAFTIGLLILFLGALNDMLNEVDAIDTAYIMQYAMFIYLLVYAYIFADKSHQIRREAEKLAREVSQVRNNLEELVKERTTALQSVSRQLEQQKKKLESSNRELVEAMNARNRLFSIIGHDVRAPIGYTRQALEMMMVNKEMTGEERDELLRMMASTSETTYNLLDNLLVWGRSQTGKLKANPGRFKLKELIDESLELVSIGIREKKLKVEVFVSEEHFLEADRDQLYVVIRNLLSNAIKFTPERGSICISSKKQKGEVVISVRDTGIGIPKAIQAKLLDSSSHVSTDGTKGEKGSGLGFKICHEIVQTNNGWMKIESVSGSGTTILVGIRSGRKTA
jgi:signal transduction histidine kinase